jgi:hypothetical protein
MYVDSWTVQLILRTDIISQPVAKNVLGLILLVVNSLVALVLVVLSVLNLGEPPFVEATILYFH